MKGRIVLLLAAASLTMGAVVVQPAVPIGISAGERASSVAVLNDLAGAVGSGDAAVSATANRIVLRDALRAAPADVARWWSELPARTAAALQRDAPGVIGNLDGLPYSVRDVANRSALQRTVVLLGDQLTNDPGRGAALALSARLTALRQVQTALERPEGGPARFLVSLDPVHASRAAVAIGDPDLATYVDFLVPGMFFSVRDQIVDWTDTAADLQAEQTGWLQRLHGAGQAAVISWIGYATPDAVSVLGIGDAEDGARRIADAVRGVTAARPGNIPFVAITAHSYGGTAALLALQSHAMRVDALAMVGVPGSPAAHASQLDVPAGQVYAGRDAWDPVARSSYFGVSPTDQTFGSVALGTGSGVDPITDVRLNSAVGHNGYFAPGSQSLRNLALIGIGEGALVTEDGDEGTLAFAAP